MADLAQLQKDVNGLLSEIEKKRRKEALQKKRDLESERDRQRLKEHFQKERQTIVM